MESDLSRIFWNRCKFSFPNFARIDASFNDIPLLFAVFQNCTYYFYYKNKRFYLIILTHLTLSIYVLFTLQTWTRVRRFTLIFDPFYVLSRWLFQIVSCHKFKINTSLAIQRQIDSRCTWSISWHRRVLVSDSFPKPSIRNVYFLKHSLICS